MIRYSSAVAPEKRCVPKSSAEEMKWRRETAAVATRETVEPERREAVRRLAAEISMDSPSEHERPHAIWEFGEIPSSGD